MISFLPVLLLAGCEPIEWKLTPTPEFGELSIAIEAAPVAGRWTHEDEVKAELRVDVSEIVIDADGPSGRESIASFVEFEFEPYEDGAAELITFEFEEGPHRNARCTLALESYDDSHGIEFEVEDEANDVSLHFRVVEVDLAFAIGRFDIGDEPVVSRIRLDPQGWIDRLGLTNTATDVDIEPGLPRYSELVQAILDTTTYASEGGPEIPAIGDDEHDGDDDDDDDSSDDGSSP